MIPKDLKDILTLMEVEVVAAVDSKEEALKLLFEDADGNQVPLADNEDPVIEMIEGDTHFVVNGILMPNALKSLFPGFEDPTFSGVV